MDRNEVSTVFEIVLEEIEEVFDGLNNEGAEAFRRGDYDAARNQIENATRLTEFRSKVRALQKEWETLFSARMPAKHVTRRNISRLEHGRRTPEDTFRRPILESLVEFGGTGPVAKVLDRVGDKLTKTLNDIDRQPLPSSPISIRWRNTAQWCRNSLVQEGLLRSDSQFGEISDRDREVLRQGNA
jgi:restriction system protein